MALYVTRPRRDEVRIGRGLPSGTNRPRLAECKTCLPDSATLELNSDTSPADLHKALKRATTA